MKRTIVYSAAVALPLSLCSLVLYGCGAPAESESATQPSSSPAADGSGTHGDQDDGDLSDMEKMKATLAKLSPEDAASAEKQHFCPVGGGMLGVTGLPVKVDVDGQQVWICCEDCRETLLDDPAKYLAKLKIE